MRSPVFQSMGGGVFLSAAQTAFSNELLASLARNVPSIDRAVVIATGLGDIRTAFSTSLVPGIVQSYLDGLRVEFALAITLAGLSFFMAFFMPWKRRQGRRRRMSNRRQAKGRWTAFPVQ